MARIAGYSITLKLFIPAPKNNFAAQAAAATIMDAIMTDRVLTPELVAAAVVVDVSGKFGSSEAGAPADAATPPDAGDEAGSETQSDETAVEGVKKAGRSRG